MTEKELKYYLDVIDTKEINKKVNELFNQILDEVSNHFDSLVQKQSYKDLIINTPAIQEAYKNTLLKIAIQSSTELYLKITKECDRSDEQLLNHISKLGIVL